MPRLNKTGLLAVLVAASSAFLLFQLYYYRQSSVSAEHENPRGYDVMVDFIV
jgi:hypothetical protein